MTASQIFLYAIAALVLLLYIRRWYQRRNMKEYSVTEVQKLLASNDIVLLDVRTGEERGEQHIKGSIHIPLNSLSAKMNSLKQYVNKEIVCYCHSGSRSAMATLMLMQNGYHAANMQGGIAAWNYQNQRL
jgi:rhodanese-related sulfurtransferase